jgi:hypothetical protein
MNIEMPFTAPLNAGVGQHILMSPTLGEKMSEENSSTVVDISGVAEQAPLPSPNEPQVNSEVKDESKKDHPIASAIGKLIHRVEGIEHGLEAV